MKVASLIVGLAVAQDAIDERLVNFQRLPRVFDWRFVPAKKEGKYIHRIGELKQKIRWEINRCPKAGIDASKNGNGRMAEMLLDEFSDSINELDLLFSSDDALFEVSESFAYEEDDDLETPDPDPVGRQVGNRPKRPGKGKHSEWKAISQTKNPMLETVGKPPRVLLYKVNKTMVKWFNNFLPSECRKFSPIYRRMKGLKRQITKLMPKHQFITTEIEN